jgi:hypothetical protein
MRASVISVIAVVAGLAGCGHPGNLYQVTSSPDGGVPFLPIETLDVDTYTYEQSWLVLTVNGTFKTHAATPAARTPAAAAATGSDGAFPKTVVVYTRDLSTDTVDLVRQRYAEFLGAGNAALAWDASAGQLLNDLGFKVRPGPLSFAAPPVQSRVSDIRALPRLAVARTRVQVPAATPLYYNVRVPRGGTANAELDLASNGTMTKASSDKQDQLPGAIVTAAGSAISAVLGSSVLNTVAGTLLAPRVAAPQAQSAGNLDVLAVSFAIVPARRLYTLSVTHPPGSPITACGDLGALLEAGTAFGCRASLLVASDNAAGDKPKDGQPKDDKPKDKHPSD